MCTHFIKIWDGCAKNTKKKAGESKNREWTRMDTNYLTTKSTKYTKKESRGESRNHERARMDTNYLTTKNTKGTKRKQGGE